MPPPRVLSIRDIMKKNDAISKLNRQIAEIKKVKATARFGYTFKKWQRDTRIALLNIFSRDEGPAQEFDELTYSLPAFTDETPKSAHDSAYLRDLEQAEAILESCIRQIEEYWPDDSSVRSQNDNDKTLAVAIEEKDMITIFISHAKSDEALATNLVKLITDSLEVPQTTIRCTSVPGYKFSGATHVSSQIRKELNESKIVIGIISKNSLMSSYVLFELGAGWLLEKAYALISNDVDFTDLPGPLIENHALKLDDRNDLFSLIEDLCRTTGNKQKTMSLVNAAVEAFLNSLNTVRPASASSEASPNDYRSTRRKLI